MNNHPAADLFPMMSPDRFQELVDDISKNGLRVPITICDGMVLDGRNRLKACEELGITPTTSEFSGDPWSFVWSLNGQRRDLETGQRILIYGEILEKSESWQEDQEKRKEEANRGRSESQKGNDNAKKNRKGSQRTRTDSKHPSRKAKAKATRTNTAAVAKAEVLKKRRPDLADRVKKGDLSLDKAYKLMRADEAADKRKETASKAASAPISDRWFVEQGDIRNYHTDIQFDYIITDPPYPKEYLELYEILAKRANEWLSPNGLLIVMCGQSYLDQVYEKMSGYLQYYWTGCYLLPGQPTPLRDRQVNTSWKPLLMFTRPGDKYKGRIFGDVFTSDANDKSFHKWGQSESGMLSIISGICDAGQSIMDPFCGAGTTGIAAFKHGCFFHGIELEKENVDISNGRFVELTQKSKED